MNRRAISRRMVLQGIPTGLLAGGLLACGGRSRGSGAGFEGIPQVLPAGQAPDDRRLGPLLDLDGFFPFDPPETPEAWRARAEEVRRRIRLAAGLWPMPTRPKLMPVVHGPVDRGEYVVSKVYFQSVPGLYVTGNLYEPTGEHDGPRPAVLSPHGHWADGRFHDHGPEGVAREIAAGAERFERGGRHPIQARCVQLARMGCVVFQYDMIGYADSVPIPYELAHRFAEQRPELQSPERWGLFSAQAELRLQNILGLQLLNSIRALDFLLGRPNVDPKRVAVTGSSGGGTQTFLLAAVDDRLAAAFPAVMVSTAMQGGCTCENACYLRVGTGNVEIAGLFAPKPLGLTGANDWTEEIETKGLPELKRLYEMLGAAENVTGRHFDFGHNYNAPSRHFMYEFMNRALNLGVPEPIEEREYEPLSTEELSVWDDGHPRPPSTVEAEIRLLKLLDADARRHIKKSFPHDPEGLARFRAVVGEAFRLMVGRGLPEPGQVRAETIETWKHDGVSVRTVLVRFEAKGEELPAVWLEPEHAGDRSALWIDERGKAGLFDAEGRPIEPVRRLLEAGVTVLGCDLIGQGEFRNASVGFDEARSVENPREFLGYTTGYNHPLFAQRVHDIMSGLAVLRDRANGSGRVDLVALGGAGRWAAAAGAVAGNVLHALAVGTDGFRFASITEIRDPDLWPGALKYGDLPALLALNAPRALWIAGEAGELPEIVSAASRASGAQAPTSVAIDRSEEPAQAVAWLLERV